MSHTMKIWESITKGRLRNKSTLERKFGFTPGRINVIFALRQLIEQPTEKANKTYTACL